MLQEATQPTAESKEPAESPTAPKVRRSGVVMRYEYLLNMWHMLDIMDVRCDWLFFYQQYSAGVQLARRLFDFVCCKHSVFIFNMLLV